MTACMKCLQLSFYARMYTRHRIINKMPIPRSVLPSSVLTEPIFVFPITINHFFGFSVLALGCNGCIGCVMVSNSDKEIGNPIQIPPGYGMG